MSIEKEKQVGIAMAGIPDRAMLMAKAMEIACEDLGEDLGNIERELSGGTTIPPSQETLSVSERRRHVIGMERTLKKGGIRPNSPCPCGSKIKFKKCCKPLLDNPNIPFRWVAERLQMRPSDEMLVNRIMEGIMK